MAITLEEIDRRVKQEWLHSLTMEQRLAGVSAEEVLKRMPPFELAKALLRFELQRDPTQSEIDDFLKNLRQR